MDDTAKGAVASLLTLAVISNARVLDRAIAEAGVEAPEIKLTVPTLLASVNMPARLVMNRLADRSDRAQVQAIVDEYQQTGKVIENLPADEKEVRELHAREVLHVSIDELNRMPARPAGTQHTTALRRAESPAVVPLPNPELPAATPISIPVTAAVSGSRRPRHYLELHSPVVDAPSIGPKTADRLAEVQIATVGEFLEANAEELATALQTSYINPKLIRDWQDQARLAVQIPGVRGHDVQLLVAAQVRSVDQLLSMTPARLLNRVLSVALTPAGQRILRDSQPPDLNEVEEWLRWSRDARMTPPPAPLGRSGERSKPGGGQVHKISEAAVHCSNRSRQARAKQKRCLK